MAHGYGSIPEITIYAQETAIDVEQSTDEVSSSGEAAVNLSTLRKCGFVFLGFILGYGYTNFSKLVSSTSTSRDILIAKDSASHEQQLHQHTPESLTRPFMDALPFEEIYPRQLWNPVQIPPITDPDVPEPKHNASHHNKHHHSEKGRTIIAEEASGSISPYNYLKSMLGSPVSLLPTSSISTKVHTLYLASEAAFSLLYDSANPKNYYLSEYSLDYFLLTSGGFDAQINQAYCAVASVAALLNSLKYAKRFRDGDSWTFDLPVDGVYDPYPYATQNDILKGDCVSTTVIGHVEKGGELVYGILKPPYGLNLEQTSNLIKCHTSSSDWEVLYQEVDPTKMNLSKMRYDLKAALIDPDARVMVNYDRKALNQVGGGHYSPVGAYHPSTDSFLVMDVAKYKYPPVWVGADTLFDAMSTIDNCGNYDFPGAQDKLVDVSDPNDKNEYGRALDILGCKQRMRGYIVLKKKA
ncbi:hypothetical protein ACHAXN_000499 [Cyclotella atomus]